MQVVCLVVDLSVTLLLRGGPGCLGWCGTDTKKRRAGLMPFGHDRETSSDLSKGLELHASLSDGGSARGQEGKGGK